MNNEQNYRPPQYQPTGGHVGPGGYMPPGFIPPYQRVQYQRPLRRDANVIGGALLMVHVLMLLIYRLLDVLFQYIGPAMPNLTTWELMEQSIELISYIAGFWIPTAFMVAMIRIPVGAAFPLRKPRMSILIPAIFVCLGTSMVGSIASATVASVFETLFGLIPTMPDMSSPMGVPGNIVYVLSMTLAPAIFEELMFRGVIMQSLRRYGDGFALVTSAILFGAVHGNLIQGPNAILMGLAIGYFVLRTGSIFTGMAIHFVNNGLAVLLSYLYDLLPEHQAELLSMGMFGGYLLLGAIGLVFLIVRHNNMFRVAPSAYPLTNGRKYATFFLAITVLLFAGFTVVLTSLYFL